MFDEFNTEGFHKKDCFSKEELDSMNSLLTERLESGELFWLPEYERKQIISESILRRY
jgi:hypothetical protein